jgi:formylglycine-generating enzyme
MRARAQSNEKPQHVVRIKAPFYVQTSEVTQAQWKAVMSTTPGSLYVGSNCARSVSWNDAREFCRQLSTKEGVTYRLPTEAEWEYACRAATTTAYSFGDDVYRLADFAAFRGDTSRAEEDYTGEVEQKKPNAFGLYDMHGNLSEWCQDWYDRGYYAISPLNDPQGPSQGSERVYRGGSWFSPPRDCRSAVRKGLSPSDRVSDLGFRVVRSAAR